MCIWPDYRDDLIRDQIVFGINSEKVREKLITEGAKLSVEKAIQICQSYEYAQQQLKQMKQQSEKQVDVVKSKQD